MSFGTLSVLDYSDYISITGRKELDFLLVNPR